MKAENQKYAFGVFFYLFFYLNLLYIYLKLSNNSSFFYIIIQRCEVYVRSIFKTGNNKKL